MVHYSLNFAAYKAASKGGFPLMWDPEPWFQLQLLVLRKNGLHTNDNLEFRFFFFNFVKIVSPKVDCILMIRMYQCNLLKCLINSNHIA